MLRDGSAIRKRIGVALDNLLGWPATGVRIAIFLGVASGIWWPIIQANKESTDSMWSLLLIPLAGCGRRGYEVRNGQC